MSFEKLKTYMPTRFMLPTSRYDKKAADLVVMFIEQLKHTKGDFYGKPFELMPWQEKIVRDIFGTLKPNGYRQFTTAYIEIPKKNGKSEFGAPIALYLTCADGEQRAEVYSCAADREQASLVFDVACDMVKLNPILNKYCDIRPSRKTITYKPTNSVYKALSADVAGKSGVNVSGLVFDELWVQKDRKFFDMMTKGTSDARKNPLHLIITTAGDDVNSICYELHQKAENILAGRINDPTFYPCIFGADPDDDWTDPAVWAKANPSLGITIDIEKVQAACESAKLNPSEENTFRQLRLDQWVKQSVRWMPMEKWDKCAFPVNRDELKGRICYGGLDLSSTTDITAFVLVFPPRDETESYIVLPYFWLPEETLSLRVKRDHVPYDQWKAEGLINTTEGNVIHYAYIEKFIEKLGEQFNIQELAFDRWGAVQMVQNLENHGLYCYPIWTGL